MTAPVKGCPIPALNRRHVGIRLTFSGQVLDKPRGRKPRDVAPWSRRCAGLWGFESSRVVMRLRQGHSCGQSHRPDGQSQAAQMQSLVRIAGENARYAGMAQRLPVSALADNNPTRGLGGDGCYLSCSTSLYWRRPDRLSPHQGLDNDHRCSTARADVGWPFGLNQAGVARLIARS